MAAGRLEVEVTANTAKLDAKLGQVEGTLKNTGKTLDQEMSTPLGNAAIKAGKLFAAMGAIEGATKLASGGISGLSGLFASINGDAEAAQRHFDALAETAKSLPFGIGPVVSAFEQILHSASGLNEELALQEEAMARIADLDRQIAESRSRKSVITSLETQVKLAREKDVINRADLEYMATFLRLQEEHKQKLRESVGKSRRERESIRKDSEETMTLQQELARLQMEAVIDAENMRVALEKQRQLEFDKLEAKRKQREEDRDALKLQREAERVQKQKLGEAKKAADILMRKEEERKKMESDSASATSSAQTAFGTFKFGQMRQGNGQEKANTHLQGIEEGVKTLLTLISVSMRGIGFR